MIPLPADSEDPGSSGSPFSAPDALFTWMQEIAPFGIFTTDRELRIRSWNRWLAVRSGLSAERLLGAHLLDVFPDLQARRLHERYERALSGEIIVLSAALHKYLLPLPPSTPSDGTPHMLQTVRIAPLPAGELTVGTLTIIEDVTERECQAIALQRQQEHDRLLSSALAVLLRSHDPMHDVAELFPALAPSLGIDMFFNHVFDADAQTLRLSAAGGIPLKQKEALAAIARGDGPCGAAVTTGQPTWVPRLQEDSDPRWRDLRGSGLRLFGCFPLAIAGELLGTLSVGSYSRDVLLADEWKFLATLAQYIAIAMERTKRESQLRVAQQKLQEHAENLETKVNERTARLHETIAQLESFSYTVAHDLRAPIRSIKGYAEIIGEDYGSLLPAEGQGLVNRLQRAGAQLDVLTRDLLRFSKIARADVTLGPVDLGELIQDIMLLNPALEKTVTVHSPLGVVCGQRTLLHQCFSNLFDNALKFVATDTAPRIVVRSEQKSVGEDGGSRPPHAAFIPSTLAEDASGSATRARTESASPRAWLRVWIEDNGVGIPEYACQKIFGIFERASGAETVEGTGIGLAIVARAMQGMGGSCGVESEVGAGSRFWLELPVWQPKE